MMGAHSRSAENGAQNWKKKYRKLRKISEKEEKDKGKNEKGDWEISNWSRIQGAHCAQYLMKSGV